MWWLMPLLNTAALLSVVLLPAMLGAMIWGARGLLVVGVTQALLLKAVLVANRE